ncbi:GTPase [Chloroflexota bacterium]
MPANLPPQYYEIEKTFRAAKTSEEKIAILEEMLAIMPKHKGTDHLRAELRSKIAKITQQIGKKSGTRRASMAVEREGAAQVAVIGPPNAGKSQLITNITNATPTIAEYPFTTQTAAPGMMAFENIQIQLIDTPPLSPTPMEWWLRHILIRADAMCVMIDLTNNPLMQMNDITSKLEEVRIAAEGLKPENPEAIIYHKKTLVIANKLDLDNSRQNYDILKERYQDKLPMVAISAKEEDSMENLRKAIYLMLGIIRVYTKTPGQKAEHKNPIILKKGSTLENAAADVHKDFVRNLKYARVWGSGKHDGLRVKRDHILEDNDVVELHL